MEEYAYLTSIFAGAFYLIASLRLTRLSRRTGERPERLLGIYFGLSGVYYVGFNLPSLLGFAPWTAEIEWVLEWIYVAGIFPYLFFISSVFRPDSTWAGVLVWLCAVLLMVGTLMGELSTYAAYSLDNPWFVMQWAGYSIPCVWLCGEATLSHQGARRRARLGLCTPVVANRYLLLALFGGFQILACLADLSYAGDLTNGETASLVSEVMLGGTEIVSVAVLWLTFFPPRGYSNWINRRAVILPTQTDG